MHAKIKLNGDVTFVGRFIKLHITQVVNNGIGIGLGPGSRVFTKANKCACSGRRYFYCSIYGCFVEVAGKRVVFNYFPVANYPGAAPCSTGCISITIRFTGRISRIARSAGLIALVTVAIVFGCSIASAVARTVIR